MRYKSPKDESCPSWVGIDPVILFPYKDLQLRKKKIDWEKKLKNKEVRTGIPRMKAFPVLSGLFLSKGLNPNL